MAVATLQVTLGAGVTPIIPSGNIFFKWVIFQNNAAANMRLGDANVTSSRGLLLQPVGSATPPYSVPVTGNLAKWFVIGTTAQVLDVIYDDGND